MWTWQIEPFFPVLATSLSKTDKILVAQEIMEYVQKMLKKIPEALQIAKYSEMFFFIDFKFWFEWNTSSVRRVRGEGHNWDNTYVN